MFASPEMKQMVLNLMTDTQYYCERCDQTFEYRYPEQHGCEQCNLTIQDNNIAELPPGARA